MMGRHVPNFTMPSGGQRDFALTKSGELKSSTRAKPGLADPAQTAPVGIMALARSSCRWPVTDEAPWLFCGRRKSHCAFCAEHGAVAYRGNGGKL